MTTTKTILTMAVIAALPFRATAENISGAMYTAPATADTNHPAPTTSAGPLYGRVNIDTADQEHIATTAYVKGAYNSAIAAVNKVNDTLSSLNSFVNNDIEDEIAGKQDMLVDMQGLEMSGEVADANFFINRLDNPSGLAGYLVTADGAAAGILTVRDAMDSRIDGLSDDLDAQRVTIYTTWDDDSANATTQVALSTAQ